MSGQEILSPLRAVAESTFEIFGVTLRCYVLEDGMRLIDASDMHDLIRAFEDGEIEVTDGDAKRLADFIRGAQ